MLNTMTARSNVVPFSVPVRHPADASGGGVLQAMGAPMSFPRNAEIYSEEEPAEFIYRLVSGVVRVVKLLSDGRRQISAFHLPGDTFGLEGGETHRFSAEAVSDAVVIVLRRSVARSLAERDADLARELWDIAARDLGRAQEHMLLLGRKSAVERVAAFLLDIAERGGDGHAVDLAMSRQDIADYLGLTIETVSRTVTLLEQRGLIEVEGSRHIVLANPRALGKLSS